MNAKPADRETVTFDYGIPAELFMGKRKGGPRQPLRYRRFATAAEAIRFAVEELPAVRALGAWMQVGDQRFDGDDIQRLYESNDYSLAKLEAMLRRLLVGMSEFGTYWTCRGELRISALRGEADVMCSF